MGCSVSEPIHVTPTSYLQGDSVEYYSIRKKSWYKAEIQKGDENTKSYVVKLDGTNQRKTVKRKNARIQLRNSFRTFDKVEFYIFESKKWCLATIISPKYARDGTIGVDVADGPGRQRARSCQLRRLRNLQPNTVEDSNGYETLKGEDMANNE
mmetsp:Transcript_34882/g.67841  ORF Transcript_34882/g.67841 Transcript_34882/m.67841 type:complete len:153 (-) Transcript_34882:642-1100(-)